MVVVGGLRISRDRKIEWGQKSKPPKIPRAPNKISSQNNPFAGLRSRDTWELSPIFRLFWIPPKNTWKIFQPKNIPKSKMSNSQKPSIIPVAWNPEYPPPRDREPSSTRWVLISLSSYLLPCYNKLNEKGSNESQNSNCFSRKRKEKSSTKISCFRLYTREC